ncbi:hypothetical protein Sjap_013169 [Stephania japonica]|uniref:Uncharacterized protein n=1 Tax=Stephania japonica TaxID=461633 RepID=A0AAP0IX92_9MAGN
MQLKVEFAFGEKSEEEYSNEEEFIFFEEESVNFIEVPKFDSDEYKFVEDKIAFGDDSFVIEVVLLFEVPQVFEEVVDDTGINKSSLKDFSNYRIFVVHFSDDEESANFDGSAKVDSDGYDFVEDKIIIGDEGFVIEVVLLFEVP